MKRSANRCESWRERLGLLAGGALAEREAGEVRQHLAACAACRRYHDELKAVAAPLADWEKNFSRLEPQPALRTRWRTAVLAAKNSEPVGRFSFRLAFRTSWLELVRPCRHAWAAMAALWLVMAGINAAISGAPPNVLSARSSASSTAIQVFEEQRRVLAELIPPIINQPIEPPRRDSPHPRSQRKTRWSIG